MNWKNVFARGPLRSTNEIPKERERLEKEILQISEREQRRIGHDLHDSVCQHLAATTMAGQILGDEHKLAREIGPEASERQHCKAARRQPSVDTEPRARDCPCGNGHGRPCYGPFRVCDKHFPALPGRVSFKVQYSAKN